MIKCKVFIRLDRTEQTEHCLVQLIAFESATTDHCMSVIDLLIERKWYNMEIISTPAGIHSDRNALVEMAFTQLLARLERVNPHSEDVSRVKLQQLEWLIKEDDVFFCFSTCLR